jgi:hypothetical protein
MTRFPDSDLRDIYATCPMADTIIYDPDGPEEREIRAFWNNPSRENMSFPQGPGGAPLTNIVSNEISATFPIGNYPMPEKKARIAKDGVIYTIREVLDNGHGQATVYLWKN